MSKCLLLCVVIGVVLALASSTNLRSQSQQSRKLENTPKQAHQYGEIDWLNRGIGSPTKSPSSGIHRPTWKPSFKPIESADIIALNPRTVGLGGLKGEDHKTDEKEILHLIPTHNINEKVTPITTTTTTTTESTDSIVPDTTETTVSSPAVTTSTSTEETVPSSTSNLLPLDPTVTQEEGQTIEDVVAHTTITVVPTTTVSTTTTTTNTDSSGNSAEITAVVDNTNVASSPRPMNSINTKTTKAPLVLTTTSNSVSIPTLVTPTVVNDVVISKSSKAEASVDAISTMTSSKLTKKEEKQETKEEKKTEKKEEKKVEKQAAKEQEREEEVSKSAKESKRTQHEKGEEAKEEKPVMFIPLSERPYTNMKNLSE